MTKAIVEIVAVLAAFVVLEWMYGALTRTRPPYVLVLAYVLIRVSVAVYLQSRSAQRRAQR